MAVNNSLQKTGQTKPSFSKWIELPMVQSRIGQMVKGERGNRFTTAMIAAVATNPALAECDPNTILSSALVGEALQLSPSPQLGQFFMVPFNNRKENKKDAQFVIGYKGYIQLAIRSGQYRTLNVIALKEGEVVDWNPITENMEVNLIMSEEAREKAPTIGYYAMFELLNGFRKAIYWPIKKMELHADKYVPSFNLSVYKKLQAGGKVQDAWKYSGFWYTGFDHQGMKTMMRQLISKWGIMSIEMQTAFEKDTESMKKIDAEDSSEPVNVTGDRTNVGTIDIDKL